MSPQDHKFKLKGGRILSILLRSALPAVLPDRCQSRGKISPSVSHWGSVETALPEKKDKISNPRFKKLISGKGNLMHNSLIRF